MKHVLLFLNLLFFVAYTKAQSPNWQWAQQAGGNSYEYLGGGYFNADGGMAIDSVGNIYITGGFSSDTMHFGSSPIARSGPSYNVWLAKYSPAGIFLWAVSTGGAATVGVTGITLSTDGEPIITGSFNGDTLRFGSIELYGSESEDIYVAKFSPTGAPIWARHYGGSGSDFPGTITCDSNDNLYVCGSFYSPTLNLGTISLVNPAVCNGFLAKLDAAGLPVWAVTTGDGGTVQTCRIGLDDTGNIYISGTFAIDTITFGSTLLVPFSNNWADIFCAKYNPAGVPQWATAVGGGHLDRVLDMYVNRGGEVHLVGNLWSTTVNFGSNLMSNQLSGGIGYVAKFNAGGTVQWASPIYANSNYPVWVSGVTSDTAGRVYVTGVYGWSANFPSGTIPALSNQDGFLATYDTSGSLVNAFTFQGTLTGSRVEGVTLVHDRFGNLYLGGAFVGDLNLGQNTLTALGNSDVFLAKYGYACSAAPPMPGGLSGPDTVCAGTANFYTVAPVPSATSYIWTIPPGWAGGSGSSLISVVSDTTDGMITVTATNSCGVSAVRSKWVVAQPSPTALITQNGMVLTTAPGQGSYQWYMNNVPVWGATQNTYQVGQPAAYYVVVTNPFHCSDTSNTIQVTAVSVADVVGHGLNAYPQPNKGQFFVRLPENAGKARVSVFTLDGRETEAVFKLEHGVVDIRVLDPVPGVYITRIHTGEWEYNLKTTIY